MSFTGWVGGIFVVPFGALPWRRIQILVFVICAPDMVHVVLPVVHGVGMTLDLVQVVRVRVVLVLMRVQLIVLVVPCRMRLLVVVRC